MAALSLDVTHWTTITEKRTGWDVSHVRTGMRRVDLHTIAVAAHEANPAGLTVESHKHGQVPKASQKP